MVCAWSVLHRLLSHNAVKVLSRPLKTEKTGQNFAHIAPHSAGPRQKTFCANDTTLHLPPPLIDVRCLHIIHPRTAKLPVAAERHNQSGFSVENSLHGKTHHEHDTEPKMITKTCSVWIVWPRDRQDDDFRSRSIFKASTIHFSANGAFQNRGKKRSQFRSWVVIAVK